MRILLFDEEDHCKSFQKHSIRRASFYQKKEGQKKMFNKKVTETEQKAKP